MLRPVPRALRALLPLAFAIGFPVLMLLLSVQRSQAAIIGWRIEARACQSPTLCAEFPAGRRLWAGRYACQGRAGILAEMAGHSAPGALGLPKGTYTFIVRCAPVEGMPGA